MELKEQLKNYRELSKKSQKEIALYLGLTPTGYFHIEKGDCLPNINTLIKLSDLYNVSLDSLVGREYNNNFNLPPLSNDQKTAIQMLLKLNIENFIKAFSYISGLYVSQ